ncbi:AAA domain-containing protein [Xylella fastidiosa]|uniref:AAA domain-containing protein n=1 Tax=Xylella fastidiosa TaxID=2371 RepID=UPI000765FAD5|nr:AAA domain-containing protein [Xylella fastidiosa]ALR01393.1 phospholipase [Xylella fastidiosa]KXB15801.1 phospholipase [Xylella fastidiosa]KXB20128.1 phospholipase [Xylella fastidiosa]MDG5823799.1 AAA domain-containing protein [Xylella fastidiosa subsp. pauca]MDG5824930.1 AAA domain-containing protein [Xylella fastidiosa subsp. pauca]
MQARSSAYARYWRHSLADSAANGGTFRHDPDPSEFRKLSKAHLASGCVGRDIVTACFNKEAEQVQTVEVVIRLKVYVLLLQHGTPQRAGNPKIVTPLVTQALLARDGRIYPLAKTMIPRDILKPLAGGHFTIGTVADQDAFLTRQPVPGIAFTGTENNGDSLEESNNADFDRQWKEFLAGCDRLLAEVGGAWPGAQGDYLEADYGYLTKKAAFSSRHILALYDHLLLETTPQVPLFERYASGEMAPPEPCLPPHAGFSQRLAHGNNEHPLTRTQRDALTHLLVARQGEILAVNGPPGTGKTTLVLSVVASLWAHAALAGGEPPVIVAASTTNQAVTNIIDAFGKNFANGEGPFAGRWLPKIKSFGALLGAAEKESKTADKYHTEDFFNAVESTGYIAEAEQHYLRAAAAAFPEIPQASFNVKGVTAALQGAIRKEAATLAAIEQAWSRLNRARDALRAELGETPAATMTQRRTQQDASQAEKQVIETLITQWERYAADESLVYGLFSWLPAVAKKRMRLVRVFLKSIWPVHYPAQTWESIEQVDGWLSGMQRQCDQRLQEHCQAVTRGEAVLDEEQRHITTWRQEALAPLRLTEAEAAGQVSLADCDAHADTSIRFRIFLLTTHYWEGRWLSEMQTQLPGDLDEEKKKTGRTAVEPRWRRRMKLTPCIVSTFFMLPKKMQVFRRDGENFMSDYLYDFADLLIVDEAGQVLPEVAGASFALGKQALVIGDQLQIEPIWSIPESIDIGNLSSVGLLGKEEDAYERLCQSGRSAALGSVMQIAQRLSRYHYDPAMARGMFLHEHHRCFDEIVSYCNALCYQGKLIPQRGPKVAALKNAEGKETGDSLPALGYLHVDGLCQKSSGGSRYNLYEAETIAAWLAEHHESLQAQYGEPLHRIVGILTPFETQARAISQACRDVGIEVGHEKDGITVGTVHALQGAERPVVIFSAVYSKHADGGFIDQRASMLNVAVSRAKNTFLVFGDMDVFTAAPKSRPRGLLAHYLFKDPSNALCFQPLVRKDLQQVSTAVEVLQDAAEHDAFLLQALNKVQREIHIVSPWINKDRIQDIGAFKAMQEAVERQVQVTVYTDQDLNTDDKKDTKKIAEVLQAARALRGVGIEVHFVDRVHSKMVIGDDEVFCVGSFNWFSANRSAMYAKHETSLVYRGRGLADERQTRLNSLRQRITDDPQQVGQA